MIHRCSPWSAESAPYYPDTTSKPEVASHFTSRIALASNYMTVDARACIELAVALLAPLQFALVPSGSAAAMELRLACRIAGPVGRRSYVEGMDRHDTLARHPVCLSIFRPVSDFRVSSNHIPFATGHPWADDTDPPHTYCRLVPVDSSSASVGPDTQRCWQGRFASCAVG